MPMRKFSLILLVFFSVACSSIDEGAEVQAIQNVLNEQKDAWNQGDLQSYMMGYWQDSALVFSGGKNVSFGWEAALQRYERSYPTQEHMGFLHFDDVKITLLHNDLAFATGSWHITRERGDADGRFTLVWRKEKDGWKIIADHSS